jgi:crossover junction endodeoxyribonuclease RuvC
MLYRVLAFDPGFERLGVAVIAREKNKVSLLYSDCVRTDAKLPFPERLRVLGEETERLIKKYKPAAVALEDVYFAKNEKTAMKIARVAGMLAYIAAKNGLTLFEYTPMQVKVAITGWGKGDKKAIAAMVPRLIALPNKKRLDDELDAIAIGLTCLASVR